MERRKHTADKIIINRMNLIRYMPLCFIVIIMICIGLLVYYKNWEDHYYFMEFIPVILAYFLFAITGQKINIIQYINVDIKQKVVRKIYEERDVNLCELKDLKDTKEQKEKQL